MSNQKLIFDIDYAGRWLGVGDHVCLYHLKHMSGDSYCVLEWGCTPLRSVERKSRGGTDVANTKIHCTQGYESIEFIHGHVLTSSLDSIGSVGFNPLKSWLLSIAGSRNFDYDDDGSESDNSDEDSEDGGIKIVTVKRRWNSRPADTSVKLWDFAPAQGEQRSSS